jgi:endonuclease YncB( thermonuclease family)
LVTPAIADDVIAGVGQPIDGDTFKIGDTVIRLADVDAPELAQRCEGGPKSLRRCGAYVADLLRERLQQGEVHCKVQEIDQYDRSIAGCSQGDDDLSTWLVRGGWALAYRDYSDRLVGVEDEARQQRLGLWQTSFEPPWTFRAKRWQVAVQQAPDGCPIKGNISRDDEYIYHTPWGSQWYDRTKISINKGERWFCSEREALDAGWRAPLR